MNESAEVRATAAPQPATRTAATHTMLTLLKREVWEHPALWVAPLAVSAVLLVGAIFFRAYAHLPSTIPMSLGDGPPRPESAQTIATMGLVVGYAWTQYFVMGVVLWFYATACLYNERRDRSILFWKSMPVSDAKTVLSKMLMVLAVAPLYVYVVTLLTTLVASVIFAIPRFYGPSPFSLWSGGAWVRAQVFAFTWLVVAMLWYAPFNAYLLAISAWARRNVQLWALSPIIAAIVERIAFGTHYLWTWILYRLLPAWQWHGWQGFERVFSGPGFAPGQLFDGIDPLRGSENIDLWIGLAVAVALLYAAVRIRRYRDDT